jgi:hypothetical protein
MPVSPRFRLIGLLCLLGGSLQLIDTPLDMWWSAPTSPIHAVALVIWTIANVALMGGPVGIITRRFVPRGGAAIAGAGLTLLGNLCQIGGMLCYLLFPHTAGGQVLTPLGGILITLGMVVLGIATLGGKKLSGWQAWVPLLVGLYFLVQLVVVQIPFFLRRGHPLFAPLLDLWGLFWILLALVIVWSEAVPEQAPLA